MRQNVSCSGAETSAIIGSWKDNVHDLEAQVDALGPNVKHITLTIGGNDVKFKQFATRCVLNDCGYDTDAYQETRNLIEYALDEKLIRVYKTILDKTERQRARLYVIGYPQVLGSKKPTDSFDARCSYLYGQQGVPSQHPWEEADAARQVVDALNQKILSTVERVAADPKYGFVRIRFISATEPDSPFNGHGVCDSGISYFQNLDQGITNAAYVFHPNVLGQQAYAQLIRKAILG